MPTTKLTLRNTEWVIEGENAEEIIRIMQSAQAQTALPHEKPAPEAVQALKSRLGEHWEEFSEPDEADVNPASGSSTPSSALAEFTPPPGPARRAPQIESDPEIRDRQRQAAANAREALAARRAAEKLAKETATPLTPEALSSVPPAARRGRPPKAATAAKTVDLSGDREEGDHIHSPDTEPIDPHADAGRINGSVEPTSTLSSTEKQQQIFAAMREVSQVSTSGMEAVKQTVATFGVSKIKDVSADRLDELWVATETLCGTFNVQFPPP